MKTLEKKDFTIKKPDEIYTREFVLDIPYDEQKPFDKPRPLFLIELKEYLNNPLFKETMDNLVTVIRNSKVLQGINLHDPFISFVYKRDWDVSWDIAVEFFMQIEQSSKFYFFEAELNTSQKEKTKDFKPKIYKCLCFSIDKDVIKTDDLIDYLDESLKIFQDGKYSSYDIVNIFMAKVLFDYRLINPQHFVVFCTVKDSSKNEFNAIATISIEEQSDKPLAASFDLISSLIDFFKVSNDISYEIFTPINVKNSVHLNLALEFIQKTKLLGDILFCKDLYDLLSGISIKQSQKDLLEIILNFINIPSIVYQITLVCKKEGQDLQFSVKLVEKFFMTDVSKTNKNLPNTQIIQCALDNLISSNKKLSKFNQSEVDKIVSLYICINDNLIFPEHCEVKFIAKNRIRNAPPVYLIMIYAIHDFDNELIPLTIYELDSKGNFIPGIQIKKSNNYIYEKINSNISSKNQSLRHEIPIVNSSSSNLKSVIEKYFTYVKKELKEKVEPTYIDDRLPSTILFSNLKIFNDGNELTSFILMRIKNKFEDAISELTLNINDLLSPESEVKSLRTFTLNSLDEKDYLPYELLISILWGNSCNNTYFGLEVVKMKRSCWLENSYFKYIYSLEFNINQSKNNNNILFGEKNDSVYQVIMPISYCSGK